MYEAKGKGDRKIIVFVDELESGVVGSLLSMVEHDLFKDAKIVGMPDIHPGKGFCNGLVMTIADKVFPAFMGTDMGCGVLGIKFEAKKKNMNLESLDKYISSGEMYRSIQRKIAGSEPASFRYSDKEARHCFGTIGNGNHFIEIGVDKDSNYWLFIHSGSRYLGKLLYDKGMEVATKSSPEGTPYYYSYLIGKEAFDFINNANIVESYAKDNREAIMHDILDFLKANANSIDKIDLAHNSISCDTSFYTSEDGTCADDMSNVYTHRKGAIYANLSQDVLIPINMRDGVIWGKGIGNVEWLSCAPHGAGRLIKRSDCSSVFTTSQFKKEMTGIYSSSVGKETLDECPMAYKPIDFILQKIKPVVDVIDIIKPIYNYKVSDKKGKD